MNIKFLTIIVVIVVAIVLLFGYKNFQNKNLKVYTDQINKVSFIHDQSWQVKSINGFVTISQDPKDGNAIKIIMTVNPSALLVEVFGFSGSNAKDIKIGDKSLKVIHKNIKTPGQTDTMLSQFYWQDKGDRAYIFEVTPQQGDVLNRDLIKVLRSLKSILK